MKKLTVVLLSIAFLACNPNRIYEEHTDPSGNLEWNHDEILEFDIEIIDTSIKYNVILALRFANGYPFSFLDVELEETSPSGGKIFLEHQFRTLDEDGYTGDGAGDIFDLENVIMPERKFVEPGVYHYTLNHVMEKQKLHMVMEVGMIVDQIPAEGASR